MNQSYSWRSTPPKACLSAIDSLSAYRLPHSTTGQSPAQLLMNRQLHSHLDLTSPDTSNQVPARQVAFVDRDMSQEDTSKFYCGDPVQVTNFASSPKWVAGVLERLGPTTFTVRLTNGRLWKRHFRSYLSQTTN